MKKELSEKVYTIRSGTLVTGETRETYASRTAGVRSPYYSSLHSAERLSNLWFVRDTEESVQVPSFAIETKLPFAKCPFCHSSHIQEQEKKILGIFKDVFLTCNDCKISLKKKEGGYRLLPSKDNSPWKKYEGKILTAREWQTIGTGGLSDTEQREVDIATWMSNLQNGTIRVEYIHASPLMLSQKNEEILFSLPDITLMEPRAMRVSGGTYGGPSFRIKKGVYFHLGGYNSTARSRDEIRKIDKGTLTVTNRRVIFSGGMRTINTDFAKMLAVEPFQDGLAIRRSTSQKTQYFRWNNTLTITMRVGEKSYTEPLTGTIVQHLIEGAVGQGK